MLANYPVAAMLRAEDIQRAKNFYTGTLGLSLVTEMDDQGFFMVSAGQGTMISVYQRPGPAPENNVAVWQVDDIDAAYDALSANGVTFEHYEMPDFEVDERGIATTGPARTAWFKDSEGNILMITQM